MVYPFQSLDTLADAANFENITNSPTSGSKRLFDYLDVCRKGSTFYRYEKWRGLSDVLIVTFRCPFDPAAKMYLIEREKLLRAIRERKQIDLSAEIPIFSGLQVYDVLAQYAEEYRENASV